MCISSNRRKKKTTNLKKNKKVSKTNKSTSNKQTLKYGVPLLKIGASERNKNIKLMRSIFEVQSVSGDTYEMFDFIVSFIKNLKDDSISFDSDTLGNIYVTKGEAETYPCIVSHIDTVHSLIPKNNYVVLNSKTDFFAINLATKNQTGIGGDDNNGIYCCLDNLLREEKIKLAFFVDEEIGCVGSRSANMSFFDNVSFVLQADRQDYADVAVNIYGIEMFDESFFEYILEDLDNYNRSLVDGGMTDVMQLAENGLQVPMANFSCGYYRPHSDSEYVIIDELILTSLLFRDIIKSAYTDGHRHEMKRELKSGYGGYDYSGFGSGGTKYKDVTDPLLAKDDFGMDNSDYVNPRGKIIDYNNEECSYCGQPLNYDRDADLFYCHNCQEYDYNK